MMFRQRAVVILEGCCGEIEEKKSDKGSFGFNFPVECGSLVSKVSFQKEDRLSNGQKALLAELRKLSPGTYVRVRGELRPDYKAQPEIIGLGFEVFGDDGKLKTKFGEAVPSSSAA